MVYPIRTITIASTLLLTTSCFVHAEDQESSLLNLGIKPLNIEVQQQKLHRVDTNMSSREYETTYNRNRKLVQNNLNAYSRDMLNVIGIPDHIGSRMGAALGVAINDSATLNLNESKTLALEFDNVSNQGRALYFKIKLNW